MPRGPDLSALREDLEIACMDAMRGDPPGRLLAGRLERVCKDVLRRSGLAKARVVVESNRSGTRVHVALPKPDRTVQRVVLTLG